jgi:hypothetical protein
MSTTITNRLSLVQRRGDAELPANGRWTLHRASFVGISTRRHRRQLSVADGSLTIVGPPDQSTLVITAALAQQWMRLTASTVAVDADGFGFSRWQLNGTVDDGTTRHPSELDIRYHGVHGRGDQARAWFTGRAATPSGTYDSGTGDSNSTSCSTCSSTHRRTPPRPRRPTRPPTSSPPRSPQAIPVDPVIQPPRSNDASQPQQPRLSPEADACLTNHGYRLYVLAPTECQSPAPARSRTHSTFPSTQETIP